ncbi:MAG TPA: Rrf2 family transcriptional regulator [Smithellaceae bacterium]|jgi:Rrf2 family protein|nr:Rrf2 family transcriptional regulator [Smithellaceae bacterium]HQM45868.1 Rrf2 family transcriptional regulator [Smithellaceae bacterium]
MKLSTRTRYGVRLMMALAIQYGQGPVFLKDIARGENISEKYLSLIIIPLRSVGLVNSIRGAHGGYHLSKEPSQITLKEIVDVLEGDCSLVDCVKNPSSCSRAPICASHDIWAIVGNKISETLNSITLDTLIKMNQEKAENTIMQGI